MTSLSEEELLLIARLPLSVEMRILLIDRAPKVGLRLAGSLDNRQAKEQTA